MRKVLINGYCQSNSGRSKQRIKFETMPYILPLFLGDEEPLNKISTLLFIYFCSSGKVPVCLQKIMILNVNFYDLIPVYVSLRTKQQLVVEEMPDVKYSEVFLLDKLQDLEQHIYPPIQSDFSFLFAPPHVKIGNTFTKNLPEARKSSINYLDSTPCIYSNILHCAPYKNLPSPFLPFSDLQSSERQTRPVCIHDVQLPAEGASESSGCQPSEHQENCNFLKRLQIQESLSDSSRASHQTQHDSPDAALFLKDGDPLNNFWKLFPPVPQLGLMDLFSRPVQCGPYIPSHS